MVRWQSGGFVGRWANWWRRSAEGDNGKMAKQVAPSFYGVKLVHSDAEMAKPVGPLGGGLIGDINLHGR